MSTVRNLLAVAFMLAGLVLAWGFWVLDLGFLVYAVIRAVEAPGLVGVVAWLAAWFNGSWLGYLLFAAASDGCAHVSLRIQA